MENTLILTDDYFMKAAIKEAQIALKEDEVPIGAVIVCKNTIIAKGHNMTQRLNDVTAHAEMIAFTSAASYLNSKYLIDCTLYVTVEPCIMCAGASYWTQIPRIVFGARDEKRGFIRVEYPLLHPSTILTGGIMENECSLLMQDYFRTKR
jgi:tRNA(adenine34) deaminase